MTSSLIGVMWGTDVMGGGQTSRSFSEPGSVEVNAYPSTPTLVARSARIRPPTHIPPLPPTPPGDPVIAAAGDIACDPANASYYLGVGTPAECRMKATSDLLVGMQLAAVLALGDNQYEEGALTAFYESYDRTWGRVMALTRPVLGNHEYDTRWGAGHFAYFGEAAGELFPGYYSYEIGSWHLPRGPRCSYRTMPSRSCNGSQRGPLRGPGSQPA